MSKELDKIPISKVRRASKLITTGAKVGTNYVKHYAAAAVSGKLNREGLEEDNASDIYDSLSELKGSALKMAQLLSMDQNILPKAYTDRFAMAQYSAPPLSYPLVKKTFRSSFGKDPNQLFDSFSSKASNAASMGQVHKAEKDGQQLAVKVQYPGVANSIKSDLKLAKPFALKLMNVKGKDIDIYMKEVEGKLLEEADYDLELKQSINFANSCQHLNQVRFPEYYPEYSSKQILTMSWLGGTPLDTWIKQESSQDERNRLGQTLWDFYMFQMHELRIMHADPHPGNFIIDKENNLGVIDFGCLKHIPADFYDAYFELARHDTLDDAGKVDRLFKELEIFKPKDSKRDRGIVTVMFTDLIRHLSTPFNSNQFDFSNQAFFNRIYELSEGIRKDPELSRLQARGSRHFVYFNRTFFGLYNILYMLKADISTDKTRPLPIAS